jgi:hypothetical protein
VGGTERVVRLSVAGGQRAKVMDLGQVFVCSSPRIVCVEDGRDVKKVQMLLSRRVESTGVGQRTEVTELTG